MELSTLCTVLQGCLSPDLSTRKAAEDELSKVQHSLSLYNIVSLVLLSCCSTSMQVSELIDESRAEEDALLDVSMS